MDQPLYFRSNIVLGGVRSALEKESFRVTRVRDRALMQRSVAEECEGLVEDQSPWPLPTPILVQALIEGFWDYRETQSLQESAWGVAKAVKSLVGLLKAAPGAAWAALKAALGLEDLEGLSLMQKIRLITSRAVALAKQGKAVLGKALKKVASTFPLSMFFVSSSKMPGLTDLVARILAKVPRLRKALEKIKSGAHHVDTWLKKYVPRLSRALYAAIFIYVWINVAELSWDLEGILKGFTGAISLGDLLASMPESALGLLAASFGLGYGALPYVLIARLVWLVAQKFLTYVPGKGFQVHWPKLGVDEPDELVQA